VKPERRSSPLAEIDKFTSVLFPYGATVIHYEREMEFDALIRAKLLVAPAQWQGFLGARGSSPARSRKSGATFCSNVDWWKPGDTRQLPTAQVRLPGAGVIDVDRSDPQRMPVFLVWHRTCGCLQICLTAVSLPQAAINL